MTSAGREKGEEISLPIMLPTCKNLSGCGCQSLHVIGNKGNGR
jgi:hypothetical protein